MPYITSVERIAVMCLTETTDLAVLLQLVIRSDGQPVVLPRVHPSPLAGLVLL